MIAEKAIIAQQGSISAGHIGQVTYYAAPVPGTPWQRVRVGAVPPLASAFQPRRGLRERIERARAKHATVVLTQVLSGGGGVGKSQLAAACAHQAHAEGVDVLVWVNAAETVQVVAAYATAAQRVGAPGADGQDPVADARAFLAWLSVTERTWLVVLDDLVDLEGARDWWPSLPAGDNGRVLATTRRRDALVSGTGRDVIDVGTYSHEEAVAYLRDRLTGARTPHLLDGHTGALVRELGLLPLALGHAAAYMINEDVPCAAYLQRFTARQSTLTTLLPPGADTEGYGRQVTASLLLALDAAQQREPKGLAVPAIRLAACLDPAGHPREVWTTAAAATYLTTHRAAPAAHTDQSPPADVTPDQAHAALRLLHHYALLTIDGQAGHRAVRLHALTARAARETTPPAEALAAVTAAATALTEIWPANDHTAPVLAAVLRANADTLAAGAGDLLWQSDGRPVLFRTGSSLLNAGLFTAAITHWHHLAADSERLLGEEHPTTLAARGNLASSYRQAGRTADAIALLERVVADSERLLGEEHPTTLAARGNLAVSYWQAGRTADAIVIEERVVADRERLLGEEHPDTLTARANLAASYRQAGRTADAIALLERVVADRERLLGEEHPTTLTARANLASSYRQAGRTADAIALLERVVADSERLLGEEHPTTLTARANLASSYRQAGRTADAIALLERVVADSERLLGEEHPDTLTARANLASSYWQAGRTADAIVIEERVVADRERLLGEEHPTTLTARANLAASYRQAGRTADAIVIEERVVADSERLLGEEHPDTLAARAHLASSYRQAGRTADAIALLERVVADSERLLGEEHPTTLTARANLASSYRQAGRTADAIALLERVVADSERLLGEEHPTTLTARANLASSYRQAGRTADAIALLERVVADSERLLGEEHPDTLTARANLASSYWQAGRTADAIVIEERVVADRERLLGEEHPTTLTAAEALRAWRDAGAP